MEDLTDLFVLPEATAGSEPSWFGFPLALRREAPFGRRDLLRHLDERRIATRLLFAGNLARQPAYEGVPHRVVGTLHQADFVTEQVFWLGVYPGLSDAALDYVLEVLHDVAEHGIPGVDGRGRRWRAGAPVS
jgi:CDP-6-deoxy-D-xylo-4-hexulose-3-dehydrase